MILTHRPQRLVRPILVCGLLLWSLLPILWNVENSLKTREQIFAWPPRLVFRPNLDGYKDAFGASGVLPQLRNSVELTAITVLLTIMFSVMAGYGLSRYRFAGRRAVLFGILAARLLPPISAVVPLYLLASKLHLVDTLVALALINTALNLPLATWLLKSYVDAIPHEIEEASALDGCGAGRSIRHVTLPLMAPGLVATSLFVFVLTWNEFMFAFMFSSVHARTMPVMLAALQGDEVVAWQSLAAQATILLIPVVVLAPILQRYLVRGMTAGAIK